MKMFDKYSNSQKSIIATWIISFGAVLIIPIISLLACWFAFGRVTANTTDMYCNDMINVSSTTLSSLIDENARFVTMANSAQSMTEALNLTKNDSQSVIYYTLGELRNEILNFKSRLNINSRFYIYFSKLDIIVSENEILDSRDFFDLYYKDSNIRYTEWLDKITYNSKRNVLLSDQNKVSNAFQITLLPIDLKYNKCASIVLDISSESFQKKMHERTNIDMVYVVTDKNDEVFMTSNNISYYDVDNIKKKSSKEQIKLNGINYKIRSYQDEKNGYKYICMIPVNEIMSEMRGVNVLTFLLILSACLVSIYLIRYVAKKNYEPIKGILLTLKNNTDKKSDNEYDVIKDAVDNILVQNNKAKDIIKENEIFFKYHYISRLLKNSIYADEKNLPYSIKLRGNRFSVLLIEVEDIEGLIDDDETLSEEEKNNTIIFVLRNVTEEYVESLNITGFLVDVGEDAIEPVGALLLNFDNDDKHADEESKNVADFIYKFFRDNLNLEMNIAISNVYTGITNVMAAYNNTLEIMEYKKIWNNQNIMTINDISEENRNKKWFYSVFKEQALTNAIKCGNFENAKKQFDEVFEDIISSKPDSYSLKLQIDSIVGSVVRISQEINVNLNKVIINYDSVSETKKNIYAAIKSLCNNFNDAASKKKNLKSEIEKYICENYADINLNVTQIADSLSLTRSYISTAYKEQSGISIMDYISRFRIEHVKKLLQTTNLSMNEITHRVGYSESRTMIRTFKKYNGITPSQYKNTL